MSDWDALKRLSPSAYSFIKEIAQKEYMDGHYELSEGCYVNIETYTTQYRGDRKYESHRRYIDIQYMIFGKELITVHPVTGLVVCDEYDSEKDITFYKNDVAGVDKLLEEGTFFIITPDVAHMPCICIDEKTTVRKAVVKVPLRKEAL